MEFAEQEVRLRTGRCDACGHEFTFLEGAAPPVPASSLSEGEPAAAPAAPAESLLECDECGSPLSMRARRDGSIEARCEECESTTIYVPRGAAEEEEEERPPRRRTPEGPGGPRGRPCRQCGAPLRFTTNEEGLLVGECEACGNRFTLPPRTGGGREGGRFRRGGGPAGRSYGDRRGGSRWGGRSWQGDRRPREFRSRSFGSDDEGRARRSRRRRRAEE